MQPIPKWALWLGAALAWVAGVAFALFAFAAPARSELAFTPERARLVCAGVAPKTLKGHGNGVTVPAPIEGQSRDCRVEIDFSVTDTALAARAAASGYVELMGLRLARGAFPQRFAVNREGIALAPRPEGGLTLTFAFDTLFGGERSRGAALILAWRTDAGAEARAYLSPTLLLERAEPPSLLRAKRAGD
ncbi:MAG TPA: hypothetical protein VIF14_11570 [Alphaproteobacteria bacterium]|jgi:hypothetical protein